MPAGTKTGGFEFTIKTKKSCKEQLNKDWWHTIKICDETGEMLVDVMVGKKYNPIATSSIRIITCEVQDAELLNKPIKKLYTDEYQLPATTGEPPNIYDTGYEPPDWEKISEGKVRHGVTCSFIQAGELKMDDLTGRDIRIINSLVDFIMKGK